MHFPVPGGGGGALLYWEYWGCAAGQGAFLSFQLWHKLGQGVFLATRRIGTGSGFEHAAGAPLPISKASTPPPPLPPARVPSVVWMLASDGDATLRRHWVSVSCVNLHCSRAF